MELLADAFPRAPRRVPQQSGMQWVMETMNNPEQCHNMFRMRADQIHALYNLLVSMAGGPMRYVLWKQLECFCTPWQVVIP